MRSRPAWRPAPFPLQPDAPALVPTERLVERARIIKDGVEIATLREAGRRLARSRGGCHRSWRPDAESAMSRPTSSWPCGRPGSPGRPSRRSSRPGPTAPCRTPGRRTGGCEAGDADGAGLRGGLRRILRGSYAYGSAWGRPSAALQRLYAAVARGPAGGALRPSGPGVAAERHRRRGPAVLERHGLGKRSVMGPGTASGSRCTRSRGSPGGAAGCRTSRSSPAWSSPSSRAPTCRRRRRPDGRRRAGDRDGCEVLTDVLSTGRYQ